MKRMTFTGIGLLLMAIGTVLADSECILIPIALMAVGATFVLCGKKRGEQNEQQRRSLGSAAGAIRSERIKQYK